MTAKKNVLVVDDEQFILKMSKDLLEKHGYNVATASNTIGAGYLLGSFNPDLVLLDIMLPGSLSGDQACETLRNLQPDIKIVFYSGIDQEQLKNLGDKHQADAIVSKGTRPTELLKIIDDLLGISR
jgi:DNA-binding response OmpR family regulator